MHERQGFFPDSLVLISCEESYQQIRLYPMRNTAAQPVIIPEEGVLVYSLNI